MKFVIVGTGGTGGVLGGYLAQAGNDVTFIARGKHLEAIRENGLTIETVHKGNFTVKPAKACTMDEYNDTPDVILICVKYYNIQDTIELVKRTAGPETIVLPVLNVFGTGGIIQKEVPDKCCLDGTMYVVSEVSAPGVIKQNMKILRVFFGHRKDQPKILEEKCRQLEKVFNDAEIEGHFSSNIERDALQKFAFVSPMGAAAVYHGVTSEAFQADGAVRSDFAGLIQEVVNLGKAMGITFENDLVATGLKLIDSYGPGGTTSMQRDILADRQSEFSGLVDRVVDLGRELKTEVPIYTKISNWGKEKGIK